MQMAYPYTDLNFQYTAGTGELLKVVNGVLTVDGTEVASATNTATEITWDLSGNSLGTLEVAGLDTATTRDDLLVSLDSVDITSDVVWDFYPVKDLANYDTVVDPLVEYTGDDTKTFDERLDEHDAEILAGQQKVNEALAKIALDGGTTKENLEALDVAVRDLQSAAGGDAANFATDIAENTELLARAKEMLTGNVGANLVGAVDAVADAYNAEKVLGLPSTIDIEDLDIDGVTYTKCIAHFNEEFDKLTLQVTLVNLPYVIEITDINNVEKTVAFVISHKDVKPIENANYKITTKKPIPEADIQLDIQNGRLIPTAMVNKTATDKVSYTVTSDLDNDGTEESDIIGDDS